MGKTIAALAGGATEAVFIGPRRVVKSQMIRERYSLDLIEGMAMDVGSRAYASLDDALTYAYHVAGVVRLMMARIMGVRDRAIPERGCDLGIAFQLTNIARDVVPDAALSPVYLPYRAAWTEADARRFHWGIGAERPPGIAARTSRISHLGAVAVASAEAAVLERFPAGWSH